MHRDLIRRWNATVGPDDEVWVLGDVAKDRLDWGLSLVGALHGHKVLVAGNHDRCHPLHGAAATRWLPRYLAAGFRTITPQQTSLAIGDRHVDLCHFPPAGDVLPSDRHVTYRPPDTGGWLLHGHVHEEWQRRGRWINVGIDVWDLRPVPEDELVDLMARADAAELLSQESRGRPRRRAS
jgi:calcineurin-like phosphoesterase family protein